MTVQAEEDTDRALHVECRTEEGWTVLSLSGSLLQRNSFVLHDSVRQLSSPAKVVIDLTALTYMDRRTLPTIISIRRRLEQEIAGVLRVVSSNPSVNKLFDDSGLSRILRVFEDQQAALTLGV